MLVAMDRRINGTNWTTSTGVSSFSYRIPSTIIFTPIITRSRNAIQWSLAEMNPTKVTPAGERHPCLEDGKTYTDDHGGIDQPGLCRRPDRKRDGKTVHREPDARKNMSEVIDLCLNCGMTNQKFLPAVRHARDQPGISARNPQDFLRTYLLVLDLQHHIHISGAGHRKEPLEICGINRFRMGARTFACLLRTVVDHRDPVCLVPCRPDPIEEGRQRFAVVVQGMVECIEEDGHASFVADGAAIRNRV